MVVLATFVLLFLAFGSVLLPLKAIIMNMLSLSVMFGVLVWVFQEGHLSGLLHFTPNGTINPSTPILMFAIMFGLSMDYEVFLLSRIREHYRATGDNTAAIATGLQRTGGVITSAALMLGVVIGPFSLSGVTFTKMMGIGMIVALIVDATRRSGSSFVPATMKLLGERQLVGTGTAAPVLRQVRFQGEPGHASFFPGRGAGHDLKRSDGREDLLISRSYGRGRQRHALSAISRRATRHLGASDRLLVIVGFDGSEPAWRALEAARRLITGRVGIIEIVYVAHTPASAGMSPDAQLEIRNGFDAAEQEFAAEIKARMEPGEQRWRFQRRDGNISHELLAAADEAAARLWRRGDGHHRRRERSADLPPRGRLRPGLARAPRPVPDRRRSLRALSLPAACPGLSGQFVERKVHACDDDVRPAPERCAQHEVDVVVEQPVAPVVSDDDRDKNDDLLVGLGTELVDEADDGLDDR